ncbi:hypothetical protein ABIA00_005458 [Bradyrhizobium ottawaense]|uniref:hypothetical protein n=1 Tax=Bradyrhizobium ottawaense TaxID=931866 RepID=UPI003837EC57
MSRFLIALLMTVVLAGISSAQTPVSPTNTIQEALKKKVVRVGGGVTKPQDALDAAYREVSRITQISLAVALNQDALGRALNAQIIAADKRFSDLELALDRQLITATVRYVGEAEIQGLGKVGAKTKIRAHFAPAVDYVEQAGEPAQFRLRLAVRELELQDVTITRNQNRIPIVGSLIDATAEALADQVLKAAAVLLSTLEFRAPAGVVSALSLKKKESKKQIVSWEPEKLPLQLKITALAFIADQGRFFVLAQEGGDAQAAKSEAVTPEKVRAAVAALLAKSSISWLRDGDFSIFVNAELPAKIVAQAMSRGPICMNASAPEFPAKFGNKLQLPPTESIDCSPQKDCTPRGGCDPGTHCEQTNDCRACLLRVAGRCQARGNDPICEARKVGARNLCEAQKSAKIAACTAEQAGEKLKCEAQKTGERLACESFKGLYDGVRRTGKEYANVSSKDLAIAGSARICLTEAALDPASLRLTAKLTIAGSANAKGTVSFMPLNIGHVVCIKEYSKALNLTAAVPSQSIQIDTTVRLVSDATSAGVDVNVANPVRVLVPFEAFVEQLAKDDNFTVSCPIPSTAAKVRVATPDRWWPREARGIIDREIPPTALDLDVVQKPVSATGLQLTGKLKRTDKGFGGTFKATSVQRIAAFGSNQ